MAVNKVVFGNTTVMDITDSTVDSDSLLTGVKAYGADGDPVIGGVVKSWTGTAAQYAQEASQIPDGTQVNILDDFTPVGMPIGIADIYSTEEREIGVWIDGKPLYQKTLAYTLGTDLTTIVNADLNNVDTMLPILGIYNSTDNVFRPLTFVFPGLESSNIRYSSSIGYDKTNNTFEIYRSNGLKSICNDLKIIVKYTKTTDQPGSGKYVPSGAPAVHYSTDEQIIGTWTDGKPLYQKTYEIASITVGTTESSTVLDSAFSSSGKRLINVNGSCEWGTNDGTAFRLVPFIYPSSGIYFDVIVASGELKISCMRTSGTSTVYNTKVTILYTKTTD